MSYDIKIQNYCDHKILWAQAQLESDRRMVYFPYPMASTASLIVRVNGVEMPADSFNIRTKRQPLSLVVVSSIEFYSKIKHQNPIVELFYLTFPETCPKCLNIKTTDDFYITGSGDYGVTSKELLLLQRVEKAIVTKISSNPFHFWYGTDLHSLIGTKISDRTLMETRVREQISNAIEKLKTTQERMVSSNRQYDPGELFGKLLKIDIEETEDPTMILVTVSFTSQSGTPMEYSQYLSTNLTTTRQRMVL